MTINPEIVKSPLRLFPKQRMVTNSLRVADTVMAVCANRSGKTTIAIDVLAEWGITRGRPDNRGIIISSDHGVIEDNIINPFMLNWPSLVSSYNSQKHVLKLKNGHSIWCISPLNMGALEGKSKVSYVIIDEWITIPRFLFNAAKIRGVDEAALFLIIGTPIIEDPEREPVGLTWGRELYEMGLNPKYCGDDVPKRDRIISLKWGMADNPYIHEEEITRIENSIFMSAQEKRTRLHGDFPSLGEHIFDGALLKPDVCGYRPDELRNFRLENYMLLDTASGQKASNRGDDTAIIIVGIAPEYGIYVHECIAERFSVAEIERNLIDKARQYKVRSVGIERIPAQINFLMQSLRKSLLIQDSFRIVEITRKGSKDAKPARHGRLLPYLEQGRLKLPVDEHGNFIHGCEKLVGQMLATPFTDTTHDDCVDALADVCAPEMGIIDGMRREINLPVEPFHGVPLMTGDEMRRIRRGDSVNQDSEFTDFLCESAGLGLN